MATFGGFDFDPEVFADYMAEQPTWNNAVIASRIVTNSPTIMDLIGEKGNVATIPFYKPIDADDSAQAPINNDGVNNNTPATIAGGKQTAMLIQRMKAWQAQDFTRELTGADPMQHVARSVNGYYQQVWQKELMNIADAVMGVTGMSDHVTDLTTGTGDAQKMAAESLIYAQQKALGDMADGFGLIVMHSAVYARFKALGLVDFNKYTITNAMQSEVQLPSILGLIPLVTDRGTFTGAGSSIVYKSTIIGEGAFLGAEKNNYENPYATDNDYETKGGIQKLYTKQGRVLHPNGFSFLAENAATDSPTFAELGTTANWNLKFDHKNVKIGRILSKG